MSDSRKDVLLDALETEVGSASIDPKVLFTDDVVGWSPIASVSGLQALADLSAIHDTAFSNVVIMMRGLDEVGNKAFAEWLIEADHTGPLILDDDVVLEATGRHVQVARLHCGRLPRREDPVVPFLLRRRLADRADRRCLTRQYAIELSVEKTIRTRSTIEIPRTRSAVGGRRHRTQRRARPRRSSSATARRS